jgi:AraC-like DNA-binding protein
MNFSNDILFFVSALGAFNGFLLSLYFLFLNKTKTVANTFLGLFLLALSMRVGKSVLLFFHPETPKIIFQIGLYACFLIGPLCYYFLKASIEKTTRTPRNWQIIIGLHLIFIAILGAFYPYADHIFLWRHYFIKSIYFQWFCYLVASAFLLKPIVKKWRHEGLKPYDKWLLTIYLGSLMIFIGYILGIYNVFQGAYISGALTFSFILYLVIFIFLYREKTDDLFTYETTKYSNKKIQDADALALIERLERVINEHEIYKNPDLKLHDLAQKINISAHQLSQLLNDNLGKSFPVFINEYRIKKACTLIATDDRMKLEALAYEVGFNSKSTFFATFKKQMGMTPALFKAQSVKI